MAKGNEAALSVRTTSAGAWVWTPFFLLCLIAAAAAVRRILVLAMPPAVARVPQVAEMDALFAAHRALTLAHIVPALLFVLLLPLWFLPQVRHRAELHRRVTYGLMILGTVVGVTAALMSRYPVGGINEQAASLLYDALFLFSLGRAWVMFRRGDRVQHRRWMIRAVAVLLGIAATRPVMGVFFATQRVTHLAPQQFFGTAFWIGFTAMYIAGEAYLRVYPD